MNRVRVPLLATFFLSSACESPCLRVVEAPDVFGVPARTIEEALVMAMELDNAEVQVCDGVWEVEQAAVMTEPGRALTISGNSELGTVFELPGGSLVETRVQTFLTLQNFTVRGGDIAVQMVENEVGSILRIDDVRFTENVQGLRLGEVEALVNGATFLNNGPTDQGAGLYKAGEGRLNVASSRFEGNAAREGAALYVVGPTPILETDEFAPYLEVAGSDFRNNVARRGGAMHLGPGANLRVVGATVEANEAEELGGGAYLDVASTLYSDRSGWGEIPRDNRPEDLRWTAGSEVFEPGVEVLCRGVTGCILDPYSFP